MTDGRPPYQQLAALLRAQIASGQLAPGGRVPSVRQLAEEHGLATMTVQSALRELTNEGLITSVVGRGSFVLATPIRPATDGEPLDELRQRVIELEGRVAALESGDAPRS